MSSKERIYNSIVSEMMENDRNCSMDTLINECKGCFETAFNTLKEILFALVDRDTEEDVENFRFHMRLLNRLTA